jgi:hypothetical protein
MQPKQITSTSGEIKGKVEPNGSESTAWFMWGTSPDNLSNQTTPRTITTHNLITGMSWTLTGLDPGTTYYFETVATNPIGTSTGKLQHFTTLP